MKVMNIFGEPCAGKSLAAAELYATMGKMGLNVELVTEYPKDLVWAERHNMFVEQDYVFAKQNHRLRRLRGKVDFAVTDCPIIMCASYIPEGYPEGLDKFIVNMFNSYTNVNYFLKRNHPYIGLGRNQNEEEAGEKRIEIRAFLEQHDVHYLDLDADFAVKFIMHQLLSQPKIAQQPHGLSVLRTPPETRIQKAKRVLGSLINTELWRRNSNH